MPSSKKLLRVIVQSRSISILEENNKRMASIKEDVVILKPGSEKHLRTELSSSVSSIGEKGAESNHVKTSIDRSIVIARNESGVVKWFSFKNGYGFATVDSSGKDIFVHRSEFVSPTRREIFYIVDEGDKLEFDIVQRAKGLEAVAVTGPGGKRIPGAPMGVNRIAKKKQTSSLSQKPVESDDAVKKVNLENKKREQPKGSKDDAEKKAGKDLPKNSGPEIKDGEEKSKKQKSRRTRKFSARKANKQEEARSNEWGGAKQAEMSAQHVSSSADEKEVEDAVEHELRIRWKSFQILLFPRYSEHLLNISVNCESACCLLL
uniref:CSD domain-containing protein n=1 Tax=Ditylenchus dipsaci TaxID=166011 RepID=A0A915E995_9BILA